MAWGLIKAAQRIGIQLPQARDTGSCQKANDLAREAVSCNAVLGRTHRSGMAFLCIKSCAMAGVRCDCTAG